MNLNGKRWTEAVDAQLDLINFWRSDMGRRYGEGWVKYESEHGNGIQHPITDDMKRDGLTQGDGLAIREFHAIKNASTYWVSRDLGYVIDKAAQTLPKEPLSPRELPTPSGFVFLERPIYVTDIHGDRVGIKIFRWYPQTVTLEVSDGEIHTRALHVSWYGDRDDPDDESIARMREQNPRALENSPRWSMWHQNMWIWSEKSEDDHAQFRNDPRWLGERHMDDIEDLIPDPSENLWLWIPGDSIATWMNAFFRFASQDVTKISRGGIPRALQRRAGRAGIPEWGDVRIIDLRRHHYVGGEPGESDSEAWTRWTHRWEVNGYWRRQWVGSDDPDSAAHKEHGSRHWVWKWVDGHVKGPDYLPLVVKDDIRRVVR